MPTCQPRRASIASIAGESSAPGWISPRFYGQLLRAESFSGDPRCVWSGPVERVPAGITHRGHSTSNYCPSQPMTRSPRDRAGESTGVNEGFHRLDNPTRNARHDSAFNPRMSGPRYSRGREVSSLDARRQKFTRADLYSRTRRYHTSRSAWQYGVSRTIARPPALYHSANILRSHDHRDDHVTREHSVCREVLVEEATGTTLVVRHRVP